MRRSAWIPRAFPSAHTLATALLISSQLSGLFAACRAIAVSSIALAVVANGSDSELSDFEEEVPVVFIAIGFDSKRTIVTAPSRCNTFVYGCLC